MMNQSEANQQRMVELLEKLKEFTNEELSKIRYEFNGDKEIKTRLPNEKELKDFLKDLLKELYAEKRYGITLAQYRSLKGEVMHGKFESLFNFSRKRGIPNVKEQVYTFASCPCMQDVTVEVVFPGVVSRTVIDIDVNNINKNGG